MKKTIFLLIFLGLFFLSFPCLAREDFITTYKVRYQVNPNGTARVSQDISLTNKLSHVYATQYTLTFQSTEITNVQAKDELGPLKVGIKKTEDLTLITLEFNQEVVGTGKTLNFNLFYDAQDLVDKTGQVWEILVPKLTNASEIDNYQLELLVPQTMGELAYLSPQPITTTEEGNNRVYRFTKNQVADAGVSAAFGQFQVFSFILNYHIHNERLIPANLEIALPPDTAFQRVFYESLEPKPTNVRLDEDGNWLATYHLSPNQKIEAELIGQVKIFSQPQKDFPQPSAETLQKNLQEQEFWPVNHTTIQAKAKELNSVEEIFDYVVNVLSYNFDRVKEGAERMGALEAMENPEKAICMEFTDLFITLARAAGIPAREINGYAYTTNPKLRPLSLVSDVLHSWPEYWHDEKKVWLPVDPTWEKTTGGVDFFNKTDLNHFAFAIHGTDSQLPAPAGSYREENQKQKNIQVTFGKFEALPESKIEANFNLPQSIFAGLKTKGKIEVLNLGPAAIYSLPTQIQGENINVEVKSEESQTILPPFGKKQIYVSLSTENWWELGQGKIILAVNGQKFEQTIKIKSFFWQLILPIIGIVLILATIVFFLVKLTLKKRRATKDIER